MTEETAAETAAESMQPKTGEEVRLAIVLNGGVSLAVWMGGVAHEVDLLRRASRVARGESEADVGGVASHDREVFAAWVELCRRSGVGEVVVDVVAGTSAGGLNGTLLATAVARGVPLDPPGDGAGPRLREVWSTRARLEEGNLLRRREASDQPSVLDGDFFRDSISQEVRDIGPAPKGARRDPVTLFVTGTALGPSSRHYRDSFGQPFDVADHRRLYRFRRTESDGVVYAPGADLPVDAWWVGSVVDDFVEGPSSPDDPAGDDAHTALVTAARASASFPVAFAPVREGPELASRRVLPPRSVEPGGERWLVDGGVLDNAPFQPVLDAITRRALTGPVRRLLVYVVPARGEAAEPQGAANPLDADHPNWAAIAGSALGFPREGDVRADIEHAADLLVRAEGSQAGPEAAFRHALGGNASAADGLLDQYRAARAVGGLLEVRAVLASTRPERRTVLSPRAGVDLDALLAEEVPWVPPAAGGTEPGEGRWAWGLGAAERACRLMARDLRDRVAAGDSADPAQLAEVAAALTRVEAVRDAVNARMVAEAVSAPADDAGVVAWARARFDELQVQEALTHCVRCASQAYASALSEELEPAAVVRAALVVEVATQAFTAYQPFSRTAPFELLRLGPDVDTPMVDGDHEAATAARAFGDKKLYGTRIGHFAAFGLLRWRAWDWAAGRLDAQTHLARALLPEHDADAWVASTQALTVRQELDVDASQWAQRRDDLRGVDDAALLGQLRSGKVGEQLAVAVVDALMRALPHQLALDARGRMANALLARKPQRRLVRVWVPLARVPARTAWGRWTARLGRSSPQR